MQSHFMEINDLNCLVWGYADSLFMSQSLIFTGAEAITLIKMNSSEPTSVNSTWVVHGVPFI